MSLREVLSLLLLRKYVYPWLSDTPNNIKLRNVAICMAPRFSSETTWKSPGEIVEIMVCILEKLQVQGEVTGRNDLR